MAADAAQPFTARPAAADLCQASVSSRAYSTISETAVLIRPAHSDATAQLDRIYSRVQWHLMPLFLAVMILNHVDRTNLAYASIMLLPDLQIGPATYGLGSALFFIPFCFFQIPSNLAVARVGVRRWLAFLLLGWGTVATCMALMHNVASFFTLRLLLGTFEAGAVPAMWYHLSSFFPPERITKPFTLLTVGILAAQAVSGPVAAAFMSMHGLGGLHGWQWLFLLEGLPTVLMSVVVWCCLPDTPACAAWLSESDRKLLEADLSAAASKPLLHQQQPSLSNAAQLGRRTHTQHLADHGFLKLFGSAVRNPFLLYMCLLGIMLAAASNTYVFFLPMIINALLSGGKPTPAGGGGHGGATKLLPVILTCIPYTLAAISSYCIAHSSQKMQELYFHTALPAIIGGVFFVLFPFLSKASMAAGFAALVLVAVSAACSIGPKTAIVHKISLGPSQVIGMPFYNSVIVLGGFVGPYVTGMVVQRTGSFASISVLFGLFLIIVAAGIIALKYVLLARDKRQAKALDSGRACSDDGTDMPAVPEAAAAAAGPGPLMHQESQGKMTDWAAADDTGVVVLQPDSLKDAHVRTRAGTGVSSNKV